MEMLKQIPGQRIRADQQVPLLALTLTPFLLDKNVAFVTANKTKILEGLGAHSELRELTELALSNTPLPKYLKKIIAAETIFNELCHA